MSAPTSSPSPEVEPNSALLLHPILQNPYFLAAAGGLLLILVLFTAFRPRTRITSRRSDTPTVLLVGPSDAGKTALFAKLSQDALTPTHTSITPSSTTFALSSLENSDLTKPVKLFDLPGHPRLRDEARKHLRGADGVIFVVDVVAVVRNAGAVAEELPPILSTLSRSSLRSTTPPKLLILAHKSDLLIRPSPPNPCPTIPPSVHSIATERIESILTREMDRLKSARGAAGGRIEGMSKVATSGGGWWARIFGGGGVVHGSAEGEAEGEEDEGLIWGGKGAFRWEDVEGVDVSWGASGLGSLRDLRGEGEEGEGLKDVREWMWDV